MNKRIWLVAFVLIALGAAAFWWFSLETSPVAPAFTDAELSKRMAAERGAPVQEQVELEKIPLGKQVRVAIGNLSLPEGQTAQASDLVLAELAGAKGLEFVERRSLELVLKELNLSASGLVRAEDVVRAGKLIHADWFVLGNATTINGANSIVVRVVDARTGILRDADVLAADSTNQEFASALSRFLRQSRQNAASGKSRVYLAIGGFEDLSLNHRQADLPSQLRSYLAAAFQTENVTLLEREAINALLHEVRLDLAGLTEKSGTPAPMQSAYWMIDGFYQSYETSELQVELVLNVRRVFGRNHQFALREKSGEPLFQRAKNSITEIMKRDQTALTPTRLTEVQAQMSFGKDLLLATDPLHRLEHVWVSEFEDLPEHEAARRKRIVEEAMRAFETVLLLEPGSREAKVCLATCLRKSFIHRNDEAREIYREIIESPANDNWTEVARKALVQTFQWTSGEERRRWFKAALAKTSDPAVAEFYRAQAEIGAEDVVLEQGENPETKRIAEKRLFEAIQSNKNVMSGKRGTHRPQFGMHDFVEAFGTNHVAAALGLVELLPRMKKEFPELMPHLLASVVIFQTDTNAPVLREFQAAVQQCSEQPDKIFKLEDFWMEIKNSVWGWAYKRQLYRLAADILEQLRLSANKADAGDFSDQEKIKLAYTYMRLERWKDALEIFQSYSKRPVQMEFSGPWGKAFTPVLTSILADECREKMGLTISARPQNFELQTNIFCLHTPSAFAVADDGVWIGISNQLIHLSFDLQTNRVANFPVPVLEPITAVCVGESNVWVGTGGAGLLEYNKASGRFQILEVKDGLLMNSISSLHYSPGILWIGFENGLGKLDTATRHARSFMASLNPLDASRLDDSPDGPPRRKVRELGMATPNELWLLVSGKGVQHYRSAENSWETLPSENGVHVTTFAIDSERLFQGLELPQTKIVVEPRTPKASTNRSDRKTLLVTNEEWSQWRTNEDWKMVSSSVGEASPKGALRSYRIRDGRTEYFLDRDALPTPPSAIALDGADLWIGGQGFLAVVDSKRKTVRRWRDIPARRVDRIEIGGGYAWLQFDKHLHRAVLNDAR